MNKVLDFVNKNPWAAIAVGVAAVGLFLQWRGTAQIRKALLGTKTITRRR